MDTRNYLFGGTTRTLIYKGLDATAMRSRAISENLANAATPGYRRIEVSFEDAVKDALKKKIDGQITDLNHMEIGKKPAMAKVEAQSYLANDPTLPGEVNNVDVDLEASKMAENQIEYNFLVQNAGFNKILAAIKGQAS